MAERFDDPDQGHDQGQGRHECPYQAHGGGSDARVSGGEELMYRGQADRNQHAATLDAMRRFNVRVGELWTYYLSMCGDIDEYEIDAYLHGLIRLPALDRDMISQSVNEMIDDICREARAPYSAGRDSNTPGTGLGMTHDVDADMDLRVDPKVGASVDADIDVVSDAHVDAAMKTVGGAGSDDRGSLEEDGVFPGIEVSARTTSAGSVLSVVYSSAAAQLFTDADLAELLTTSRSTNHATHLTGLLLYRRGRFLQVLEGPEATVRDRMAIIAADPRHTRVRVLVEETRTKRQFPDWTMGYEAISPDMSTKVPGYERSFTDEEGDADPAGTVRVLRDLIRWFQDRATPLR